MREIERFISKVDFRGPPNKCWLWTAATSRGYGQFRANGKTVGAHIFAYELANGPVPRGYEVHHKIPICGNKSCVNPAHLESVTPKQHCQLDRRFGENHYQSKKINCGTCSLPLSGENLIIYKNGSRACRSCARRRWQEWYDRTRAASDRV